MWVRFDYRTNLNNRFMSEFGIIAIVVLGAVFLGGVFTGAFLAGFIERNLPMEEAAEKQRKAFRRKNNAVKRFKIQVVKSEGEIGPCGAWYNNN
jgi:hypothetical protein